MEEQAKLQHIPVKMYRAEARLMVAAPMPGMEAGDIVVEVTPDGRLILHGELRAALKNVKELLLDEWSIGTYHRELTLPETVDGERANVTYGNGVLVVVLPTSEQFHPARLTLDTLGSGHGERVGNSGFPPS
ncbi:MAG: Hsp20/alpha crystallin family protein [Ktedonobacteraceae bacterium]|nr:Hsp20/alpha crystallin family protein [Ktedonobacteraceae bacterium]